MEHISTCLSRLLLDYRNKGWLDLDTLIETIEQEQGQDQLGSKCRKIRPSLLENDLTHRVLALMELAGTPEAEREHLIVGDLSDSQLEELHRVLSQKVRCQMGLHNDEEIVSGKEPVCQDYSIYRNGVRCEKESSPMPFVPIQ